MSIPKSVIERSRNADFAVLWQAEHEFQQTTQGIVIFRHWRPLNDIPTYNQIKKSPMLIRKGEFYKSNPALLLEVSI